jgi:hypothetical protein
MSPERASCPFRGIRTKVAMVTITIRRDDIGNRRLREALTSLCTVDGERDSCSGSSAGMPCRDGHLKARLNLYVIN